jgi:hypothetical protein
VLDIAFLCGQASNGCWGNSHNHNLPFVHVVPSQPLNLAGLAQQSLLPDPSPLQRVQRTGSAKPIGLTWPGPPHPLDQQSLGLPDDQHWDSGDGSAIRLHDGGSGDLALGGTSLAVDEALCHREKNRKVWSSIYGSPFFHLERDTDWRTNSQTALGLNTIMDTGSDARIKVLKWLHAVDVH